MLVVKILIQDIKRQIYETIIQFSKQFLDISTFRHTHAVALLQGHGTPRLGHKWINP